MGFGMAASGPVGGRPLKPLLIKRRDDACRGIDVSLLIEFAREFIWLLEGGHGLEAMCAQIGWQVEHGWGGRQ